MTSAHIDTLAALILIIFVTQTLSFPVQKTDDVKANSVSGSKVSNEEKELEGLKQSGPQSISVVKTESKSVTNVNGKEKAIMHKEEKVENSKTGQVIMDVKQDIIQSKENKEKKPETIVKTKVDIPSEGVHKTIVNENGKTTALESSDQVEDNLKRPKLTEYYTGLDGVQYSPWDVARYIFRTGDKEGLSLALRQLISEGLMSKEEAEEYMEEISMDLDLLMAKAEQKAKENAQQILSEVQEAEQAMAEEEAFEAVAEAAANAQAVNSFDATNDDIKSGIKMMVDKKSPHTMEPEESLSVESLEDLSLLGDMADFDSFLEKLKVADYLGHYYSIKPDDIIYELSKAMFQQSISEGNEEATQALRKFSKFLESEVSEKRLPQALEERVLDIMTEAFHDTLYEDPEIQILERLMEKQKQINKAESNEEEKPKKISATHQQSTALKSKLMKNQNKVRTEKENESVKPLQEKSKPNSEATQPLAHETENQETAVTTNKA